MKNSFQFSIFSFRRYVQNGWVRILRFLNAASWQLAAGMTLVETLVAVSILAVAIVAPMALTMQSLSAAYYARDQIVASNLAQEGIEAVRAVRDQNILTLALNSSAGCASPFDPPGTPIHLLCGIPIGQDFIVDARTNPPDIETCNGECEKLKTDGNLYGHEDTWIDETPFRRTIHAEYVSQNGDPDRKEEIRITVTVTREDVIGNPPPVVIGENLYRWVADDLAAE